ncbi:MAG TPA: GNAT family N-acetyltransferase [Burkholderiales bacterium]|nr:GNAT family N-acetyltransferase [Burkholderiales bacterium]
MTMHELPVDIRPLDAAELAAAAKLCACAMRRNPVHLRVFGKTPKRLDRRLRRFFAAALPYIQRKGALWGAYVDSRLIGVMGAIPPGACALDAREMLQILPHLAMSPAALLRLHRWLQVWRHNDLTEPHWHLGPLAVEPSHQSRGVGSRLLHHCFTHAGNDDALYLETDTPGNVRFYESFGFRVLKTLPVLGTPTWCMRRD